MRGLGASIFFTDYSISPAELALALEERGFESLWVAEHSHIPAIRSSPIPPRWLLGSLVRADYALPGLK